MQPSDLYSLLDGIPESETGTGSDLSIPDSPGHGDYQILESNIRATFDHQSETIREFASGNQEPRATSMVAQWPDLLNSLVAVLSQQTKDLRIAKNLIVALTRVHGLEGLHVGLDIALSMYEKFGEELHPQGKGKLPRVIKSLVSEPLLNAAMLAPLTSNLRRDLREGAAPTKTVSFLDWEDACYLEMPKADPGLVQSMRARGVMNQGEFLSRFSLLSLEYLDALLAVSVRCDEQLGRYSLVLETLFPEASVNESLQKLRSLIRSLKDRFVAAGLATLPSQAGETPEANLAPQPLSPNPVVVAQGIAISLQSRREAIDGIRKIAAYFRDNEPLSFVAASLERTARWAETPLEELLVELIPSSDALENFRNFTGVKEPEKKENDD